ncbi:MAG: hypothetical protein PHQ23_05830 [Candidatus Wallbacteria bacterium]|nr:hypothetical protein [Candidatus Wallbacteria bacterium]
MRLNRREMYYCPVCGAEVTAIRGSGFEAELFCCNVPMKKTGRKARVFFCRTCGAELIWAHEAETSPEPGCCGHQMELLG